MNRHALRVAALEKSLSDERAADGMAARELERTRAARVSGAFFVCHAYHFPLSVSIVFLSPFLIVNCRALTAY